MSQGRSLLERTQYTRELCNYFHPPIPHHETNGAVEEYHPNYDLQDPQDFCKVLCPRPGILIQGCLHPITTCCRGHGAPLYWHLKRHHQYDWMLEYQWDDMLPTLPSRNYHEELLILHARACHILLHAPPRGTLFLKSFILPTRSSGFSSHHFGPCRMVTPPPKKGEYLPPRGGSRLVNG